MKHFIRNLLLALVIATPMFAFQNCGKSQYGNSDESKLLVNYDVMGYHYTEKPDFYLDTFVYRSAASTSLNNVKILGTVSYPADLTKSVNYELTVKDADGTTVCPAKAGSLPAGVTSLEMDCVSVRATNELKVKFTVTVGTKQAVLERVY